MVLEVDSYVVEGPEEFVYQLLVLSPRKISTIIIRPFNLEGFKLVHRSPKQDANLQKKSKTYLT